MSISPSPPLPLAPPDPAPHGDPPHGVAAHEPTRRREPARDRETTDRSGELLDEQWELLERLGVGGMGEVYRATYLADRRPYAVKILAAKYAADPTTFARFQHEFMVLRRSAHRHIVAAHAFFERGGECFYSMELLDGEPLDQLVKAAPLPIERALRIGLQLCEAVSFLHQLGVLHRDLKPANVIVTQEDGVDHAKLLDLGVCKLTPRWYAGIEVRTEVERRVKTQAGVMLGTPGYMVDDGEVESEVLVDVFGLGATLFRIVMGRMPYVNSPPKASDEPRWLAQDDERIPDVLADVLKKAIAVDPVARYQTIESLRDGLDQAAREMGVIPPADGEGPPPAPAATAAGSLTTFVEIGAPGPLVAGRVQAMTAAASSAEASPPRRSTAWTIVAILGLYIFIDLALHFGGTDPHFGGTDPPPPSASSSMIAAERAVEAPRPQEPPRPQNLADHEPSTAAVDAVESVAEASPAPPAIEPAPDPASAPLSTPPADVAQTLPRSRPRLTPAAFRKLVAAKHAALDRCARSLEDGPAVDAIVRVSADGSPASVRLAPDLSFLATSCVTEVFEGLHFPPADAASTHTWPLHRLKE